GEPSELRAATAEVRLAVRGGVRLRRAPARTRSRPEDLPRPEPTDRLVVAARAGRLLVAPGDGLAPRRGAARERAAGLGVVRRGRQADDDAAAGRRLLGQVSDRRLDALGRDRRRLLLCGR